MKITLAEEERILTDVDELERTRSRSTGRDLRRLRVSFAVRNAELDDRVRDELSSAALRTDDGKPLEGEDGQLWRVGSWHYSSSDHEPLTRYVVELEEVERVVVERLKFLGLNLAVEDYKDDAREDGPFVMTALVATSGDEIRILERALLDRMRVRDGDGYFDLERVGVDSSPRRVRFGQAVWEDAEPSVKRWVLNFVDESGDRDEIFYSMLNEPELSNLRRLALAQRAMIGRLLSDLVTAGVLPPEAPAEYAKLNGNEHELQLCKTRDVSLFF